MSDVIRLLPDSVANQIAAGEVVQRPSSVVKELVENALDAGATQIDIVLLDAGRTSIQVVDNGKGMSETDARLAFERHATSKIKEANDLYALTTMGFRGEALASIAAVAQVELRTCLVGEDLGTSIQVEASKVVSQTPVQCPQGANFTVKNLFYNIPARRKFLKSDATELSNIMAEVERIVLVNPQVAFRLFHNEAEVLHLPVTTEKQRILTVFGKKLGQELLPVQVETSLIRVHGFVGRPESAVKRKAKQFFFVNRRFMKHPSFHKAVMSNYEQLIGAGEQVHYFLYLDIAPERIDVNIHPTKTEIKFQQESHIWQIIAAAVRESLGKFNAIPSIDFDTEDKPDIPVLGEYTPSATESIEGVFSTSMGYNPFQVPSTPSHGGSVRVKAKSNTWQPLYEGIEQRPASSGVSMEELLSQSNDFGIADVTEEVPTSELFTEETEIPATYQTFSQHYFYKNSYILTSVKSGLMIIDVHRAHVRILFDEYMARSSAGMVASQQLLFPEMVHFSPADVPFVQSILTELRQLGFDMSELGGGTFAVNGMPAGTEHMNPETVLTRLVQHAQEKGGKVGEEMKETLFLSLARTAAVQRGQAISAEEIDLLVERLLVLPTPNFTPDGKTVLSILPDSDIQKLLK